MSEPNWKEEAERYRVKAEQLTAELATAKTTIETLRAYLSNIGRLANAGLQKG